MGRQPFLTRLALGRSPFEPSTNHTISSEYVQLPSSLDEVTPEGATNRTQYIQIYDERGTPVNPHAREHGRRFRQAQNDVLSAIGVVERRTSPSENLPGAYQERLEQLENEDSVGNAVALASTLAENVCTWWIGSLRDRVLTFRLRDHVAFSDIIASQCHFSGPSLLYTGFPARLLSTVAIQASVYAVYVLRPVDRLLFATRASKRTKLFFQRWKHVTNSCFRVFVEIIFYPFAYQASLQRLGLLPARPLLPAWKDFIPFSSSSPIRPLSLQAGLSAATVSELCHAALVSPLVFVCLGHFLERWVYAVIYESIESTVIHPNSPDLRSPDDFKNKASAIFGLRQKSPLIVRKTIRRFLVALGWGERSPTPDVPDAYGESNQAVEIDVRRHVEVDGTQITNINRLQVPAVHAGIHPVAGDNDAVETRTPFQTIPGRGPPASPTASEQSHHGDDPRIRITSREGIVEMEVRLPAQVLSSHTEVIENARSTSAQRDAALPVPEDQVLQIYHRVTQLSTEPSQMIGAICKAQIVGLAVLPFKLVTIRLIASHYLAGHGNPVGIPPGSSWYRVLSPLSELHDLSLRSTGLLLSRVALCGMLEVAIDLTLWGCQYVAVTHIGKNYFGWGTL